jgi:butyrate kinase
LKTVLVINPGSTSTKLALAVDGQLVQNAVIAHEADAAGRSRTVWEQLPDRLTQCRAWIAKHVRSCDAVVAIGGLFRPLPGGTYLVNDVMLNDARAGVQGQHASNLGCAIADVVARGFGCPAYVVDPVSVDEFEPVAYYSGHPLIRRRSLSHAISLHAAARRASAERSVPLERSSFVIAHLGGGISVAAVRGGRIIDVNDAASDGPFSPERTGGLPLQEFIGVSRSPSMTEADVRSFVMGRGGLVAYLGTNSVAEAEARARDGDTAAENVLDAMAYQIAKEIGAMSAVLEGRVDAVVLTGGVARAASVTAAVERRIRWIAPVLIYPGDDEMTALAQGAFRVLEGSQTVLEY